MKAMDSDSNQVLTLLEENQAKFTKELREVHEDKDRLELKAKSAEEECLAKERKVEATEQVRFCPVGDRGWSGGG